MLKIQYLVGGLPFQANDYYATADGLQQVWLKRLQFYLSAFRLVDANGNPNLIEESVALVNALRDTTYLLGTSNVDSVTSVMFGVGVPPVYNHLDPSTYPPGHPLANQDPSMHWGWVAGYRFVAIEGDARQREETTANAFEIHTVEDSLYRQVQTTVSQHVVNDTLVLTLRMDIGMVLDGIPVFQGLINHSAEAEAITLMNNMATKVFLPATTSVPEPPTAMACRLTPNPAGEHCTVCLPSDGVVSVVSSNAIESVIGVFSQGQQTLNIMGFPAGSYMVALQHGAFRTNLGTLVVAR